jgi:hypothetical protein
MPSDKRILGVSMKPELAVGQLWKHSLYSSVWRVEALWSTTCALLCTSGPSAGQVAASYPIKWFNDSTWVFVGNDPSDHPEIDGYWE